MADFCGKIEKQEIKRIQVYLDNRISLNPEKYRGVLLEDSLTIAQKTLNQEVIECVFKQKWAEESKFPA